MKLKSCNDEITDTQDIVNYLNNFFVNIGPKMAENISATKSPAPSKPTTFSSTHQSLFLYPSTPQEVCDVIDQLKDKKANRSVDCDTKFIKYGKIVIASFLSQLYNSCQLQGVFPDIFKIAEVVPVFKKDDPTLATNYRPISLLSQFSKIFEKMLYSRIYSYLVRFKLLNEHQFGFRKNSSTIHAITSIYDNLLKNIENGMYNCSIFLDLSKAFDTVNHERLIWKLDHYFGIRGIALELLRDYLTNRYQYTKLLNYKSDLLQSSCGVPQGSSLGPLLFLMYINDLPQCSQFTTTLFADDTHLNLADKNLLSLERKINMEMDKVKNWLIENKLTLNFSKSCYLLINKNPKQIVSSAFNISIDGDKIERCSSTKYLGLYLDEKLSWSTHIQHLSLQLAKITGLLYRLRSYVTDDTLLMLYFSLVYSRIQYGITLWGTSAKSYMREINVRLNNVVRLMTYSKKYSHVSQLYKHLNLLKLNDIYKFEIAKFMYLLHNKKLPAVLSSQFTKIEKIHSHNTRQIHKCVYFIPQSTKSITQNLLAFRGTKLWSSLNSSIKNNRWGVFKQKYKIHLMSSY